MGVADSIRRKVQQALAPQHLVIIDESALHAGHAGSRPDGETHFRLEIIAQTFAGKSRVERQRLVYDVLAEEMVRQVHALALKTQTPDEAGFFAA